MKINIYYEFHTMENVSLETYSSANNMSFIFHKFADSLINENPNVEFNKKYRWSGTMCSINPWSSEMNVPFDKFKHAYCSETIMIIENDENKKYFIISFWDNLHGEIIAWHDLKEKCVEIFAVTGIHDLACQQDYNKIMDIPYTPINLISILIKHEELIDKYYYENVLKNDRVISDKPYIRTSSLYGFREYLNKNDDRFKIEHWGNSEFIHGDTLNEFTSNYSKYKINIDIPCGAGEWSDRMPMILGLGTCLLRPKLNIKFNRPLIPNYHYVPIECERLDDFKSLADAYVDKYEEIKNKPDLIEFISKNGREYWDKYCRRDVVIDDMVNLVDVNKLI
jgi:hypothetical protein